MAIGVGSLLEISLVMNYAGSRSMNVWQYGIDAMLGTPSATELGAAWWAAVKTTYRALPLASYGSIFQSVLIRDMSDATGVYGEYSVPTGEQAGTRSDGSGAQYATSFVACGVRLTVGTRVTRPGQKRIPFVYEQDLGGNALESAYITLVTNLMNVMSADISLGSPALGTILQPIVVSKDITGAVVASQPITGYVINPQATSQVSRKLGRGI